MAAEPRSGRKTEAKSGQSSGTRFGVFSRSGEYWTIGLGTSRFPIKDIKGLGYIQRLLQHPGKEFHALDLLLSAGHGTLTADTMVGPEEALPVGITIRRGLSGDAGEMFDAQAKREYQRRRHELHELLADQRERGNHQRADQIESEIEFYNRELVRGVGIGGRDRRTGSNAERARLSVTSAIKTALEKISEQDKELGNLLDRSIRTGSFCRYVPRPDSTGSWEFSAEGSSAAGEIPGDDPSRLRRGRNFLTAFTEGTAFVGRTAELAILMRALDQAQGGVGKFILVGGAPGVGKTRLAAEIAAEASKRNMQAFVGGCYDREDPVPFIPFVEILEAALAQARDAATLRDALGSDASEIARLLPQLRRAFPDIAAPIELPPEQSRRILFDAVTALVKRVSKIAPAVFLVDDLQWADEGTLLLLSHVAQFIPTLPILAVATYRDFELDPAGHLSRTLDELLRRHLVDSIRLKGLSENAVVEMLSALSGKAAPESVAKLFYSDTEGNPFFVEELFKHLVEQGRLIDSRGEFRGDLKRQEGDVPESVKVVIGRRLAHLGAVTSKTLGTAALIGRSFTLDLLGASTGVGTDSLLDCLDEAERAGFVTATLENPSARFRFSHELTRQVVLTRLSVARRQRLHLEIVKAIERTYPDEIEDHANDLAYHLLQAGAAAKEPDKTAHYLMLAAKREISQSAYTSAHRHLQEAFQILPKVSQGERDRTELELLVDYGVTLVVLRGWYVPEMADVYKRARELCRKLGETQRLAPVLCGLWSSHQVKGELKLALGYAEEIASLTSISNDDRTLLTGWCIGSTQFFMGQFDRAHARFQSGVRSYDRAKHRSLTLGAGMDLGAISLIYDALTLLIMGYPDQATRRMKESLALTRELDSPFTLVVCLNMVAKFYCLNREFDQLPEIVQETLALAREHGFAFWEESIAGYRTIGLAARRKTEELSESLRDASKFTDLKYELAISWARSTLAEAFISMGRFKTARNLLAEATNIMERNDERYVESEIKRIRGVLALKQVDPSSGALESAQLEAERNFRDAREIARNQGARLFELRAATELCRLLARTGRCDEGRRMLADTYESFKEGFDAPDLKEAERLLDELRLLEP